MKALKSVLALLCICGLVFTAGCAKKESGSAKEAARSNEIVMWLVGSENQAKVVQNIGREFFQDKGIDFICEAVSWGDAHTKYLTCIAGGVFPDIGTMGLTWGTEFGHLGAMVDLAREFPGDLSRIKAGTYSGLWDAVQYKNEVYGIPFDISLQVMFYRKDMIPTPPKTWEELSDLLLELRKKNKGMIFDWGSMSWIGYAPYLWQAGGDFYNPEGTKSALASPEAGRALTYFGGLYSKLGVPKTRIPLEQGMRIGDFPLAISGNWKIDSLRLSAPEITDKWSISLLPAGPTGAHTAFLGGRVMGIFDKSKNKQKAWQFIKHLYRPMIQARLYEAAQSAQDSYLPSNKSAWRLLPMEKEFKRVLQLQAEDAKGPPSVLGWDESTRFIEQAIQRVVLQGADAGTELAQAAQKMNKQLKK